MDNPETLVTLGTQETGRRQTTHRKLKRLSTRTPLQTQVLEKGTVKYSNLRTILNLAKILYYENFCI
jgi:hypothetical protein